MKKKYLSSMAVCILAALTLVGCAWEKDVLDVLGVANTAAQSLAAVVEVADPPVAPVTATAAKIFGTADIALSKLITDLQADSATTTVGQIDADMATLQQDAGSLVAAAQVKDPTKWAQINGIAGAILSMVSEIANAVPQAAPSTTVAELRAEGWEIAVTDSPAAIPAPAAGKAKRGKRTIHSAKYWRAQVRKALWEKSSNAALDGVRAAEAKKY